MMFIQNYMKPSKNDVLPLPSKKSVILSKNYVVIHFNEFMETTKTLHSSSVTNKADALKLLIVNEPGYEMVSYNSVEKITLTNQVLKLDDNFNYYYEYIFNHDSDDRDIITNLSVTLLSGKRIELSYYIGWEKYNFENVTELILIAMRSQTIKLRITFLDLPSQEEECEIRSRHYFLNQELRGLLGRTSILTDSFRYMLGLCGEIPSNHAIH